MILADDPRMLTGFGHPWVDSPPDAAPSTAARHRPAALGLALTLGVLATGCDSGGDAGPSGLDSPLISNFLVGRDDALPCSSDRKPRAASIDYRDPQGDVRGGEIVIKFRSGPFTVDDVRSPVPSGQVTVTGTTSGQVRASFCLHEASGTLDAVIVLIDAAGNRSNELSATVSALDPRA